VTSGLSALSRSLSSGVQLRPLAARARVSVAARQQRSLVVRAADDDGPAMPEFLTAGPEPGAYTRPLFGST